ncbi:MAG: Ca-activated chloride channel family protein [Rhodothermales bacterium]
MPSGSGFVSDAQGNVVITRLEQESLIAVASAGNGRLTRLEAISNTESPWLGGESGEFMLRDDSLGERWKDTGPWLVLFLLPFVAAGFRRGLLFSSPLWLVQLLILPTLFLSESADAGVWDDLWHRRDQQAQSALEENNADLAAALAVDPTISGEAFYRAQDYPGAVQSWAGTSGVDAWYNLGNALALAGDLEGAITAYDRVLAEDPEMEDALFNRELVEKMKQQQDEEQEQEGDQGENSEEESEGEPDSEQEGEGEPQEGENESEEEGEPQEGEEGQPSQEEIEMAWSEEDAQAMEQWLRRIPDDPGGLLRRKFRNQHQRRGAPQDEKKTW